MSRALLPDGAGMPRGRVHYAVLALTDIAARSSADPVTLAEIAARHDLSLRYLEQVFNRLRRAGLVRSLRGPGGGYRLARPAAQITVAAIAAAAEGDCGTSRAALAELLQAACPVCRLWGAFQSHAARFLEQVSLADVAAGRIPPAADGAPPAQPAGHAPAA